MLQRKSFFILSIFLNAVLAVSIYVSYESGYAAGKEKIKHDQKLVSDALAANPPFSGDVDLGDGRSGQVASPVHKTDWSSKTIQIEQLWSDGKWYPREPLQLDRQFAIQGHAVGEPDFEEARSEWHATLNCLNGTWRLRLVDSASALRPPVAKAGQVLPAQN